MAIKFTGNVDYRGKKAFVEREEYATLAAMKAAPELSLNEGCIAYNLEDGKHYVFRSSHTADATTGKWKLLTSEVTLPEIPAQKAVTVESQGLVHTIKFGDEVVGTINIPKDQFAKEFSYDSDAKQLKIVVKDADGANAQTLSINVADFVKAYTAGTGLQLDGTAFSLTSEYTSLPAKVTALENKVTTLEGKVQALEQKEAPTYELATAEKDGLMSKEHFKKVESIMNNIFKVNSSDYEAKATEGKLFEDAIYFVADTIAAGSTPEAFKA